jgi:3-hydroxybutyryl-CoA dehydrogenase
VKLLVVGAGTMGHGIAQVAVASGVETTLFDVDAKALERGVAAIDRIFEKGIAKGKVTAAEHEAARKRLRGSTDLATAAAEADLVIEAAPEVLDLKTRLFADLDRFAVRAQVLATNTSSLSVTAVAAATTRPQRVLGMHFFNPPYALKLLELVRAEQTDPAAIEFARRAGEQLGRDMIVVVDNPGFATSRLGCILGLEAMRMVEQGVASPEDIDKAMKLGYGHPMGPLELSDLVGLDVRLAIAEYLHRELGEQFRPPPLLRRMVRAGKLGKKSGQGFYRY